jgi:hypothetical protein
MQHTGDRKVWTDHRSTKIVNYLLPVSAIFIGMTLLGVPFKNCICIWQKLRILSWNILVIIESRIILTKLHITYPLYPASQLISYMVCLAVVWSTFRSGALISVDISCPGRQITIEN